MAKAPVGTRKARADSQGEQVRAMMGASLKINPPDGMCESQAEMQIFREVVEEFAAVDWSPHTVRLAAHLAQCLYMLGDAQKELMDEGYTTTNQRGTPVMNPMVTVTNTLSSQVFSHRRSLALNATAHNNKQQTGRQRNLNKEAQENAPGNEDSLLNTPPANHMNA